MIINDNELNQIKSNVITKRIIRLDRYYRNVYIKDTKE